MPGKPFQSKLEPYYDLIRDLREKQWSYRKIAEALGTEHGLNVSANAIFSFVKVRAKRRHVFTLPNRTPNPPPTAINPIADGFFTAAEPTPPSYENKRRPYNI